MGQLKPPYKFHYREFFLSWTELKNFAMLLLQNPTRGRRLKIKIINYGYDDEQDMGDNNLLEALKIARHELEQYHKQSGNGLGTYQCNFIDAAIHDTEAQRASDRFFATEFAGGVK